MGFWHSSNILSQPVYSPSRTYVSANLLTNQSLRKSFLLAYSLTSLALNLAKVVQVVQKILKPTHFFSLNSFCFYTFAQKSIIWPGCPGSWLLFAWTWHRWSRSSGHIWDQQSFSSWRTFVSTGLPRNQSLRVSLLSVYLLLVVVGPRLGQDGPGCLKKSETNTICHP